MRHFVPSSFPRGIRPISFLQPLGKVGPVAITVFHVRKLRLGEAIPLAHGHTQHVSESIGVQTASVRLPSSRVIL